MVLMKKIEKQKIEESKDIEKERKKFINNAEKNKKDKKWTRMLLRIRSDFLEHIDESIKDKLNSTRTSWILETIQERIKKESKRKENG